MVFSNLEKEDLLTVREVCREWHAEGTKAYINRKSIMKTMKVDQLSVQRFVNVMTPSKPVLAVRWEVVRFNLLDFSPPALLQFFTFIAPFVRKMTLGFGAYSHVNPTLRYNNPSRFVGQLARLLEELDPDSLLMPHLEYLEIAGCGGVNSSPYREAVMKVTKKVVMGAKGLHTFRCYYPFESGDGVIQAIPKGLKELHFGNPCKQ